MVFRQYHWKRERERERERERKRDSKENKGKKGEREVLPKNAQSVKLVDPKLTRKISSNEKHLEVHNPRHCVLWIMNGKGREDQRLLSLYSDINQRT